MKKVIAFLLILCMVATVLIGCSSQSANNGSQATDDKQPASSQPAEQTTGNVSDKPYAGQSIRVLFGNHNWTNFITGKLGEFEEKTGIKIVSESYTEEQLNQKVSVELATGSTNLDVFMTRPLQETKQFLKNGWLYDMTDFLKRPEAELEDFIPSAVDIFKDENGRYYGLPLITERQVLFYRKDLFEKHNLKVPTTMEELEYCASVLTDKENDIYGIASRGQTAAAVTQFSSYLRAFGGDFITDGKASINTPEAVAAFKFYGDLLRNYGPPGVLNMTWQQAAALYSQGKAAMYTDADSTYNSACGPDFPEIQKVTGFAVMPGSKPYNIGSWGLSMGAGTQKAEASFEFIKWATSFDVMGEAQKAGNTCSRKSIYEKPEYNTAFNQDLIDVIAKCSEIGVSSDRPLVIQVGKSRDLIGMVITTAIQGGDVKAAADEANKAFQAIIDEDFGK